MRPPEVPGPPSSSSTAVTASNRASQEALFGVEGVNDAEAVGNGVGIRCSSCGYLGSVHSYCSAASSCPPPCTDGPQCVWADPPYCGGGPGHLSSMSTALFYYYRGVHQSVVWKKAGEAFAEATALFGAHEATDALESP